MFVCFLICLNPDDEYYPGEEKWHPSIQELKNIVFTDGSVAVLVRLNDTKVFNNIKEGACQ